MRIKKLLLGLKNRLEYKSRKLENTHLCGLPLTVTPGTIRHQVDQDDAWFFYLAKHHEVVYDIGCNVGYTALLAMIQNPNRRYLLVDPNPNALNEAHFNLVNNQLGTQAMYSASFVSDSVDEAVKFYTLGSGAAGSMYPSHAQSAASLNSFTEVKTVTLDFLYKLYNLRPDLIKIDVEGAETLVMNGARQVANETQCAFFIEMHTVKDLGMEQAGKMILNWCSDMQYKAWYLKTGTELKSADVIRDRGKCHLLLLPNKSGYPDYLKGVSQRAPLPKTL